MNRIIGFDIARALAIGLVVLSHIDQGSRELGIYGVELFFALSGFLIGTILYRSVPEQGKWTLGGVVNFWKRRWWRTLPNYYLFLLIAILYHSEVGELPDGGWRGILPYLVFSQNLMSPNEVFYGPSWSLCVEEMFYLMFPLLLLLFHRVTGSRIGAFVISGTVLVLATAALREVAFAQYLPTDTRVTTLPRLDAIGYGVAMAVLTQLIRFNQAQRKGLAALGGLILIGVTGLHAVGDVDEVIWFHRLALVAAPLSFSLFMPLLGTWEALPPRWNRLTVPITRISQWSYSIYLSHYIIIMAVYPLFGSPRENVMINLLSKVAGLAVTLIVSRLVFRHFESRFTAMRPAEIHVAAPASGRVDNRLENPGPLPNKWCSILDLNQ